MNFQENTADLLYRAVKKAAVIPSSIKKGDLVVITGTDSDTIGTVHSLETKGITTSITLKTSSGLKILDIDDTNFIHIIQKDAMLDLRKHYEYERGSKEFDKEVDILEKEKNPNHERPQFSVDKSDKSVLPTSKISLSLRQEKKG